MESPGLGQDYGNLGIIYTTLGIFDRAFEFYDRRLEIAESRELDDRRGEANGFGNKSMALALQSDQDSRRRKKLLDESLAACDRALTMQTDIENHRGVAAVLGNRGLVKIRLGQTTQAIADFERCLRAFTDLGDGNSLELAKRHRIAAGELLKSGATAVKKFPVFREFHWSDKYGKLTDLPLTALPTTIRQEIFDDCQRIFEYFMDHCGVNP